MNAVMTFARRPLVFAAGVRDDILRNAPTDQAFFITLGMQVFVTTAMAGVAMTFALWSGMRLPPPLAVAGGIAWAGVIFVVDRGLITSMKRGTGRPFGAVAGRIVLAVLLGVAIAEPLTLWVFKPEVDRQVTVDRQKSIEEAARERSDGSRAKEIERNKREIASLGEPVKFDVPGKADVESRLNALTGEVAKAQKNLDDAQLELTKEIEGLSATGRSGCGPACRLKTQARDLAAADLATVETRDRPEIDRLKGQLAQMLQQSERRASALIADHNRRTAVLERRNADLQKQIDADFRAVVDRRETGLLAQITALWHVGDREPAAKLAHVLLGLLLVTVDVLPVLNKTRYLSGPKRPYEVLESAVNSQIGEQAAALVDTAEHERRINQSLLRQEEEMRLRVDGETARIHIEKKARLERELDAIRLERWFAFERGRIGSDRLRPLSPRELAAREDEVA